MSRPTSRGDIARQGRQATEQLGPSESAELASDAPARCGCGPGGRVGLGSNCRSKASPSASTPPLQHGVPESACSPGPGELADGRFAGTLMPEEGLEPPTRGL